MDCWKVDEGTCASPTPLLCFVQSEDMSQAYYVLSWKTTTLERLLMHAHHYASTCGRG